MQNSSLNILLVDDHQMFLDGVKAMLDKHEQYSVFGHANSATDALEILAKSPIDIVILDVNMPLMNGIELTRTIRSSNETIKIIGLSMNEDLATVKSIMEAGANGYLFKSLNEEELLKSIKEVSEGKNYLNPQLLHLLVNHESSKVDSHDILTPRELDVIKLIANGLKNVEIAENLHISSFTVKSHRKNIMSKLHLRNTADIVRYTIENGLSN